MISAIGYAGETRARKENVREVQDKAAGRSLMTSIEAVETANVDLAL
jgi:hypothetical protein